MLKFAKGNNLKKNKITFYFHQLTMFEAPTYISFPDIFIKGNNKNKQTYF